jgi:serine/threonine-protein kinase RsbW
MTAKTTKLTIKSEVENLYPLWQKINSLCSKLTTEEIILYNMGLCVTEAVMNIINHTYKHDPDKIIEILITVGEEKVVFRIIDFGENQEVLPKKELYLNPKKIAELPESGYGLFFIYHFMDEVVRRRVGNKNILCMKKNIKH